MVEMDMVDMDIVDMDMVDMGMVYKLHLHFNMLSWVTT